MSSGQDGCLREYSGSKMDLDRRVHGVGERGVQCCGVLGDVITVRCRRELGGGTSEGLLWGGEWKCCCMAVQPLASARHENQHAVLMYLYET